MTDAVVAWLRQSLPEEVVNLAKSYLDNLENGEYEALLQSPEAQALFGHAAGEDLQSIKLEESGSWNNFIFRRLSASLNDRSQSINQIIIFCIGYAALLAFIQSNVTGPPLPFSSAKAVFPQAVVQDSQRTQSLRTALIASLNQDGIAAYRLIPNVELLCIAEAVMTCPPIIKNVAAARWVKMRVAFVQQRLLSEVSSTLQNIIYDDLDMLQSDILGVGSQPGQSTDTQVEFLLERASIHIHHGLDKLARSDLEQAKKLRHFSFALTGLLGKRTKYQQNDISQLVVLARSSSDDSAANGKLPQTNYAAKAIDNEAIASKPTNLDLNDDTLLESISFSETPAESLAVHDEASLPESLKSLDPSDQPQLDPLDAVILLGLASSITNTSPSDGLTREETLPYATRVLDGGSSNWQVYTQALLVRSRVEGYKSRTVERGLLQLQALVDQVIADTATAEPGTTPSSTAEPEAATSFIPRPKDSESAPAAERLRYVFQVASPTRWDLEAELATRWVQLGGLRSALEIYERLEMWAEAALCWAATEREDKAKRMVRRQLFHATNGGPDEREGTVDEDETWEGKERDPAPLDAPRLYCILGDIDQSTEMYEKAWEVSKRRYARAQRSIGRHYFSVRDYVKAAEAYSKSLNINQLNQSSWFALGCALLELAQFPKAVEAFSRCVQLDESDAEAWSNLAAALLKIEPEETEQDGPSNTNKLDDDEEAPPSGSMKTTVQDQMANNRQDALKALKRAATLKHDSYRIWENVLIVAASISPPDYTALLAAQRQIIELRGKTDGEKCLDVEILERLAQHIITSTDGYDPAKPGLARTFVKFMDESITPLITASAPLWQLVSKLALWRNKPSSALEAEEKAWRAVTSQPGWETESEARWNEVVEATVRLCDGYESLGEKERTEGMGAGELVAKDWKFKARSAVRGILGKGISSWEGTEGWERLQERMADLKSGR
nr:tpr repeat-containing protein c19b12.01 [Quercus suber]